jgi:membrane protein DedA with SNARE-associated domain
MNPGDLAALPAVLRPIAPVYFWVSQHFVPWGFVLLFITSAAESWPVVGLFTPGEVLIVAAAFIASSLKLSLVLVVAVSLSATMLGTIAAYLFGHHFGIEGLRRLLGRWNAVPRLPRFLMIDESLVDDLAEYFQTHGVLTSLMARFAYGIKALIPPVAGATHMSFAAFLAVSFAGSALYTALLALAGFLLQRNIHVATSIVKGLSTIGSIVLAVLLVFILLMVRRIALRRRARSARALGQQSDHTSETEQVNQADEHADLH